MFDGTSVIVCSVELLEVCCPPMKDVFPLISEPTLYQSAKEPPYEVLSDVGRQRCEPLGEVRFRLLLLVHHGNDFEDLPYLLGEGPFIKELL